MVSPLIFVVGIVEGPFVGLVTGMLFVLASFGLLFLVSLVYAPIAQRNEAHTALQNMRDATPPPPDLSFGKAEIPREAYRLTLRLGDRVARKGRVITVSVANALGAGEARHVHARLSFLPGSDLTATCSPGDTQGEWTSDGDAPEIDIAGNGRPHQLAVVVVVDQPYPHTFEWTERSRAAGLTGYEISAEPVDIEITVTSGDIEPLVATLRIGCSQGTICADWTNAGPDAASNCVPWEIRPGYASWQ